MRILKRKQRVPHKLDPQKEAVFAELVGILEGAGYEVRREKLKQGAGWKVLSGSCRCGDERLVFVDRRLSQEDQIAFVTSRISQLGVVPQSTQLERLPEAVRTRLSF
jgi:hypothetical protein